MNYVVVLRDKVLHRWSDVAENSAFGNAANALLYLLEADWRKLVGEPKQGETWEQTEAAFIKARGWTDEKL